MSDWLKISDNSTFIVSGFSRVFEPFELFLTIFEFHQCCLDVSNFLMTIEQSSSIGSFSLAKSQANPKFSIHL